MSETTVNVLNIKTVHACSLQLMVLYCVIIKHYIRKTKKADLASVLLNILKV